METQTHTFEEDGSLRIGDVRFEPVSVDDKNNALNDNNAAVIFGRDEKNYARYDIFNTNGEVFCGHLDLFYDLGGYMCFAEVRNRNEGGSEVRISNLPAGKLFGAAKFPKSRSELTIEMMKVAIKIHEHNGEAGGWEPIQNGVIERRSNSGKEDSE